MKKEEMRSLPVEELEGQINKWKKELFKLSVKASVEKRAEKPHLAGEIRRRIARAHTIITQKQLGLTA